MPFSDDINQQFPDAISEAIKKKNTKMHSEELGVTGSMEITVNDKKYRYKPSILNRNPLDIRRIKANHSDRENFGEVIAAHIAIKALGQSHSPQVKTYYNPSTKHIDVISEYLEDNRGELDRFCKSFHNPQNLKGRKHPKITVLNEYQTKEPAFITRAGWQMHRDMPSSKSLARAIAISAILGDHDVNTGNMVVINHDADEKNQVTLLQTAEIGRIDYGHAFWDLLRGPSQMGGQIRNAEYPIFDFFNRTNVAYPPKGSPSKVWRDYDGLIPSTLLGEQLIEMGKNQQTNLLDGVEAAKNEFMTLFKTLCDAKDQKSIEHLLHTFKEIEQAIASQEVLEDITDKLDDDLIDITPITDYDAQKQLLEEHFDKIHQFIFNLTEDAVLSGKMMICQANLNHAIQNKDPETSLTEFVEQQKQPFIDKGLMNEAGEMQCPWLKNSRGYKAYSGDFEGYIIRQRYYQLIYDYPVPKNRRALTVFFKAIMELLTYSVQYIHRYLKNEPQRISIEEQNVQLEKKSKEVESLIDALDSRIEIGKRSGPGNN